MSRKITATVNVVISSSIKKRKVNFAAPCMVINRKIILTQESLQSIKEQHKQWSRK